jgi:hypothetical protein
MIVEYYESAAGVRRKPWRISPFVRQGIGYATAGVLFVASIALLLAMPD